MVCFTRIFSVAAAGGRELNLSEADGGLINKRDRVGRPELERFSRDR
jgi:hypothetical protein